MSERVFARKPLASRAFVAARIVKEYVLADEMHTRSLSHLQQTLQMRLDIRGSEIAVTAPAIVANRGWKPLLQSRLETAPTFSGWKPILYLCLTELPWQ